MPTQPDEWKPNDEPIFWFASLEKALDAGDLQRAAEAQRELERLGYQIKYRRRLQQSKTGGQS
ncbi:MAG: hypothetical protein QM703_25455 [Gemmatales bacterium]